MPIKVSLFVLPIIPSEAHKSTEKKESLDGMKTIEGCNRILEEYMAREKINDNIFMDKDWMETTLGHPDKPLLKANE